jgi:hypothetical protein
MQSDRGNGVVGALIAGAGARAGVKVKALQVRLGTSTLVGLSRVNQYPAVIEPATEQQRKENQPKIAHLYLLLKIKLAPEKKKLTEAKKTATTITESESKRRTP